MTDLAPPSHPAQGKRLPETPIPTSEWERAMADAQQEQAEAIERKEGDLKHPCPQCPKRFASKQGLGSHLWGAHRIGAEDNGLEKKVPAKVKQRRTKRAKTVEDVQAKNKSACPVCHSQMLTANIARHIQRQHTPQPIGVEVDDILHVVVEMICPESVPTKALPELLAWRDATQRLLDTLVSS